MLQKCSQVCKVLYFYLANNISHVVIFRKDIPYFDKSYDWICVLGIETYNDLIQIYLFLYLFTKHRISKKEYDLCSYV